MSVPVTRASRRRTEGGDPQEAAGRFLVDSQGSQRINRKEAVAQGQGTGWANGVTITTKNISSDFLHCGKRESKRCSAHQAGLRKGSANVSGINCQNPTKKSS